MGVNLLTPDGSLGVNLLTPDGGLGVNKVEGAKPRAQSLARDSITEAAQFSGFPILSGSDRNRNGFSSIERGMFPSAEMISADSVPALASV